MIRRWNLWGYVDARDVAQAVRRSLESDLDGSENFLIAAADTCMSRPSMDLMREVFPDVPITEPVDGTDTLLSIGKARAMLDYGPRYAWRDQLD
jgi:nucleoside-diphosphate-sugar epimerase